MSWRRHFSTHWKRVKRTAGLSQWRRMWPTRWSPVFGVAQTDSAGVERRFPDTPQPSQIIQYGEVYVSVSDACR